MDAAGPAEERRLEAGSESPTDASAIPHATASLPTASYPTASERPPSDRGALAEEQPARDERPETTTVQNTPERGIDLGIVVYGRMDDVDAEAVRRARGVLIADLRTRFPEFRWRVPLIRRPELPQPTRVEPVALLQHGVEERDVHGWDFALVVSASDLVPHYKSRAMAVVARLLDLGVLSTARLDPFAFDETESEAGRLELMTGRLQKLMHHVLGHLCGLPNIDEPDNLMFNLQSVGQLDTMHDLTEEQVGQMREHLVEIDDVRLEEVRGARRSRWRFYLRSAWINSHEIFDAVRGAKPWEFPRRLSRVTTAAVSSLLVLMITAESWELALSHTLPRMLCLLAIALLVTTVFILQRQRLLARREHRRLTEQVVVSNISTVLIVAAGMASTAALLFFLTMLTGVGLFGTTAVGGWAGHADRALSLEEHLLMAAFVTSLGLFVGALGTSFEDHYDVRHITFVDEET